MTTTSASVVTVRLFAGARAAAAGAEEVRFTALPGETVEDLLDRLISAYPGTAGVLPACSLLLDGVRARREEPVDRAHTLDVLPPFSGG